MKTQYFLLLIATITIYFLSDLFGPFLKQIIIAVLLCVATKSIYDIFEQKIKSKILTTLYATIILSIIFFVPLVYFIFNIVGFVNEIDQKIVMSIYNYIINIVNNIPNEYIVIKKQLATILQKVDIKTILEQVISFAGFLGKNSVAFMIDMFMIIIFYFFITLYKNELSTYLKELIPLKNEDTKNLFNQSSSVMSVVLYSIIINAFLQGILFGVFISFFEFDGLLLGILYGFASLIPIIGGAIMWLPLAMYKIVTGNINEAIIIALYSIIIISFIADTIIKPIIIKYINTKVVKTPTKINELLIFFSIVAGLSTFGFWGMIIGPAMVTFFISIVHLLKKYNNS